MNSEFIIAVHSLVLLSYRPDHMATSDLIAENVCTHPARVRKVMGFLRKGGYVVTKEGIGGGYILNCDPEQVKLSEIYRLISFGTIKPNWCSGDPDQDCVVASNMKDVMDAIFTEAEWHLVKFFDRLTIQDVLKQIKVEHLGKA